MESTKIKKVLIAMDYDETSQRVVESGYALAKALNAKVSLIHVISEQPVYYSAYNYLHEFQIDLTPDLQISTQKFLNKVTKHLDDKSIETIVKVGDISETILKTAEELKFDVIVMGSHSRRWLENIIMGSAVADVLKNTTIPLFVVPTKKQGE